MEIIGEIFTEQEYHQKKLYLRKDFAFLEIFLEHELFECLENPNAEINPLYINIILNEQVKRDLTKKSPNRNRKKIINNLFDVKDNQLGGK